MSTCIVVQYLLSLDVSGKIFIPCFPLYTIELWDDRIDGDMHHTINTITTKFVTARGGQVVQGFEQYS